MVCVEVQLGAIAEVTEAADVRRTGYPTDAEVQRMDVSVDEKVL